MEVYILDSLYRRTQVVDRFKSLIWTERFSAYGDFELDVYSTLENRNRFKEGFVLALNESYRAMTIETIEDTTDTNGEKVLKLSGRSLEAILDSRLARGSMDDLTTEPKWVLTGTPVQIATQMFHDICVSGILNVGDIIPLINEGSLFAPDTIEAPSDIITYEIDPKSLYSALTDLCNQYLLGFRLIRNFDTAQLYFDIYAGSNRTMHQTVLPAVLFSPELDNLQNTSELASSAAYKNVAYVVSPVGSEVVYSSDVSSGISGFDRQVLIVQADDITDPDPPTASALMIQRGIQELAKTRKIQAFDGEINQNSSYKYGRDYNLGDLVQTRNTDGVENDMQVTEQIFVSDQEGDRSYPTLAVNNFITIGSWLAESATEHWADLGSTDYWSTRP